MAAAAREGADYVTLSPFAGSASKPGYGPPLPRTAYAGHEIAVLALGGVDETNAHDAVAAGATGVAVMGALMRTDRPDELTARILAEVAR